MDEYSIKLLADLLGVSIRKVSRAHEVKNCYHLMEEPKEDGTMRKIWAPHEYLKEIQRKVLDKFLYRIPLGANEIFSSGSSPDAPGSTMPDSMRASIFHTSFAWTSKIASLPSPESIWLLFLARLCESKCTASEPQGCDRVKNSCSPFFLAARSGGSASSSPRQTPKWIPKLFSSGSWSSCLISPLSKAGWCRALRLRLDS